MPKIYPEEAAVGIGCAGIGCLWLTYVTAIVAIVVGVAVALWKYIFS